MPVATVSGRLATLTTSRTQRNGRLHDASSSCVILDEGEGGSKSGRVSVLDRAPEQGHHIEKVSVPSGAPAKRSAFPFNINLCVLAVRSHPHLWKRVGNHWEPAKSKEVRAFLQQFAKEFNERGGSKAFRQRLRIRTQADRLKQLAQPREACWDFTTHDRLTIGLGARHPSENGFTFEPTLGVPILPGSSVRGLLRAAGRALGHDDHVMRLLGDPPYVKAPPASDTVRRSGRVAVLAARPIHWPQLEVDLVNPHHRAYYDELRTLRSDSKQVPHATLLEDPVPAFFLTVKPDVTFRFAVRFRDREPSREDVNRIGGWLRAGLGYLGAGAKTASGYGRFKPRDEK